MQPKSFLDLPPELRLAIYESALAGEEHDLLFCAGPISLHQLPTFLSLLTALEPLNLDVFSLYLSKVKKAHNNVICFGDIDSVYQFHRQALKYEQLRDLCFCLRFVQSCLTLPAPRSEWNRPNKWKTVKDPYTKLLITQPGLAQHVWAYLGNFQRTCILGNPDDCFRFMMSRLPSCFRVGESSHSHPFDEHPPHRVIEFPPSEHGLRLVAYVEVRDYDSDLESWETRQWELSGRLADLTFEHMDMDRFDFQARKTAS